MSQMPVLTPEEERRLLDNPEYNDYKIARCGAWSLYLNTKQALIGRAYAWLHSRHVDLHPLENLTLNEYLELKLLLARYRKALGAILGTDPALVNCEWLGNDIARHRGHGHMHFIPRYETPPIFYGVEYPDHEFGRRSSYGGDQLDPEVFVLFRDQLRVALAILGLAQG